MLGRIAGTNPLFKIDNPFLTSFQYYCVIYNYFKASVPFVIAVLVLFGIEVMLTLLSFATYYTKSVRMFCGSCVIYTL